VERQNLGARSCAGLYVGLILATCSMTDTCTALLLNDAVLLFLRDSPVNPTFRAAGLLRLVEMLLQVALTCSYLPNAIWLVGSHVACLQSCPARRAFHRIRPYLNSVFDIKMHVAQLTHLFVLILSSPT
jgi:hypothetical protein